MARSLLLLLASLSPAACGLSVRVLANGASGEGRLVEVSATPSEGAALSAALCSHLPWAERGEEPFFVSEHASVFALNRGNLNSAAMLELLQDGERLYVVPRHRQFIHPADQLGRRVELMARGAGGAPIVLTTLATTPRIFHVSNLLEQEHMDTLMNDARPNFQRSTVGEQGISAKDVGGEASGRAAKVSTRTSENTWAQTTKSAVVMKQRSMEALGIQTDSGQYDERLSDGLQVVRYQQGQAYHDHLDFMSDHDPLWNYDPHQNGSNRLATVFLYLSAPTLGGQTVFPKGERVVTNATRRMLTMDEPRSPEELSKAMREKLGDNGWEKTMSQKCFEKLAVFPRKGDAIIFYSQDADGRQDPASLHGACPVIEGEKWGANLWVWNKPRKGSVPVKDDNMALTFQFPPGTIFTVRIYWVPSDDRGDTLIATMDAGRTSFTTKTYHTHRFDVYIVSEGGAAPQRIGTVVANKHSGKVQTWIVHADRVEREAEADDAVKKEL